MRKTFAKIGLVSSLLLPLLGMGTSVGATTVNAAESCTAYPPGGQNVCLSDTATITGHATLESTGGETTPCNLGELTAPVCDFDVDAGSSCTGTSDPYPTTEATTCSLGTTDGSIVNQTACGTGQITLNFSVSEADGGTVSASGVTLTFTAGSASATGVPVTEVDTDPAATYAAHAD